MPGQRKPKSKTDARAPKTSEPEIWEALRQGDAREAVTIMIHIYGNLVRKTCNKIMHNKADAADCEQAVFEKALNSIDTLKPDTWPGAWLRKIAENHCKDLKRRMQRAPFIDVHEGPPDALDPAPYADEALSQRRLAETTLDCIGKLSSESEKALRLRMTTDLSYAEMGVMLRKSPAALQMRVSRAVLALIKCLETKGIDI